MTNDNDTKTIETTEQAIFSTLRPEQFAGVRKLLDTMEEAVRRGEVEAPATPVTAPVTRRGRPRKSERSDDMNTVTNAPSAHGTPLPNSTPFDILLSQAEELGKQAGRGRDTQIRFDQIVFEQGYKGNIDLAANKHGDGVDDAAKLAEAYVRAQQGAIQWDAKAPNQRRLISNVRKCIKLGGNPKWGQGQPLTVVNDLLALRQQMRKDPAKAKKLDDAHNTFMRFATAQLKSDVLLDDPATLGSFCVKHEREPRTGEEVLDSIRKMANNLKNGKVANCADLDNSPEVMAIINSCNKRLSAIAKARAPGAGAATP